MSDLIQRTYTLETYPDREALLDKYRDWNVEFEEWHECTLDSWKEKLEELGFYDADISYSGFCCQGDGASFTAKSINVRKYLKARKLGNRFRSITNILYYDWDVWGSIYRTSNHYCHENTISLYLESNYAPGDVERDNRVYRRIQELEAHMLEDVRGVCREIYKDLKEEHDHLTSDEAIEEALMGREFDFEGEIL